MQQQAASKYTHISGRVCIRCGNRGSVRHEQAATTTTLRDECKDLATAGVSKGSKWKRTSPGDSIDATRSQDVHVSSREEGGPVEGEHTTQHVDHLPSAFEGCLPKKRQVFLGRGSQRHDALERSGRQPVQLARQDLAFAHSRGSAATSRHRRHCNLAKEKRERGGFHSESETSPVAGGLYSIQDYDIYEYPSPPHSPASPGTNGWRLLVLSHSYIARSPASKQA